MFTGTMISIDRLFQWRFQYKPFSRWCEYDEIFWSKMREFVNKSINKKDRLKRIGAINLEVFNFRKYGIDHHIKLMKYLVII